MNTKQCIKICALLLTSTSMVHADITFAAPGMKTPYTSTQLQKHVHHGMGEYWKYIIIGYEYQLYAGVPDGGRVKGGRLRYQTGDALFPGETRIKSKVNTRVILEDTLNTNYLSGTTGLVSKTFASPIIIQNQEITTCLQYSTNMFGGNDYIIIHGAALNAPPVPVGTLIAPSYVRDGGSPTLQWFITKSLTGEIIPVEFPPNTENESPNVGPVRSNNGHGNNEDGIDVSNPGKSASIWEKKGLYDTDYDGDGIPEDDEGHGGGSAISLTPVTNPDPST